MNKEKLTKLVESVYLSTQNESLVWTPSYSIFNNDTSHKYESQSSDGITKFSMTIELTKDLKLSNNCHLGVSNPNIVDGNINLYSYTDDYPVVKNIQDFIYHKYVKSLIKVPSQDKVMDDIIGAIDVSGNRDRKIETILEDSPIKEEKESKSFLKKLFGK